MGILERLADIKHEMSRTQKNKATEYHLGLLKARVAQLEAQLIEEANRSQGQSGPGFEAQRLGLAQVALIGFPSTGKSSLLCKLTNSNSAIAEYQFTTLTCIPGQMQLNGAQIQILDLPGIIQGAADGVGKGRQVISVARSVDLVLIMLDANQAEEHRIYLERELFKMGVRMNQKPKNIYLEKRKSGGIKVNFLVDCDFDFHTARTILQEFGHHNCDFTIKEKINVDEMIDFLSGNRVYVPALYVVNKIDIVSIEAVDWYAHNGYLCISVEQEYGLDYLKQRIWEELKIVRIYTKKKGEKPDLEEAVYLKKNDTIKDVTLSIHKDLLDSFGYAQVWGHSVSMSGQRVGLKHVPADGDVIQITTKQ